MRPLNAVGEELGKYVRRHCLGMAIPQLVHFPSQLFGKERQLQTMGPFYVTHGGKLARLNDSGSGSVVLVHYQLDGAPEDHFP